MVSGPLWASFYQVYSSWFLLNISSEKTDNTATEAQSQKYPNPVETKPVEKEPAVTKESIEELKTTAQPAQLESTTIEHKQSTSTPSTGAPTSTTITTTSSNSVAITDAPTSTSNAASSTTDITTNPEYASSTHRKQSTVLTTKVITSSIVTTQRDISREKTAPEVTSSSSTTSQINTPQTKSVPHTLSKGKSLSFIRLSIYRELCITMIL